jgi:hypothetical protein
MPAGLLEAQRRGKTPGKLAERPSRFSTRFRLLPTFLTAFFTAAAERSVFFDSYRSS